MVASFNIVLVMTSDPKHITTYLKDENYQSLLVICLDWFKDETMNIC